jgi:hypothetical protein
MRTLFPVLLVAALASPGPARAQTPITLNFKVSPSSCQTSVVAPSYYCLGYSYDVDPNGNPTSEYPAQDEWSIYTTVHADGTFDTGFLNLYADLDDPDATTAAQMLYFNSTSINGVSANGSFTGTFSGNLSDNVGGSLANGRTFTGSFSNLTLGTVRRCAGRYGCHDVPAIVSGSVSVTTTQTIAATPGEASHATPMLVVGYDRGSGAVSLSYAPACASTDHTAHVGRLADVATMTYLSEVCGLGTSGSATIPLESDSYFWVIVGNDGARAGSYGTDGNGAERPADSVPGACNLPQDLSLRCDP